MRSTLEPIPGSSPRVIYYAFALTRHNFLGNMFLNAALRRARGTDRRELRTRAGLGSAARPARLAGSLGRLRTVTRSVERHATRRSRVRQGVGCLVRRRDAHLVTTVPPLDVSHRRERCRRPLRQFRLAAGQTRRACLRRVTFDPSYPPASAQPMHCSCLAPSLPSARRAMRTRTRLMRLARLLVADDEARRVAMRDRTLRTVAVICNEYRDTTSVSHSSKRRS